jgi:hypothetical protein
MSLVYTTPFKKEEVYTNRGYFAGGYANFGNTNEVAGFDFNTETTLSPTVTLSQAREGAGGIWSTSSAYIGGGYATGYSSEIDGFTFATETAINPGVGLSLQRTNVAGNSGATSGYFSGGTSGTTVATVDKFTFATETNNTTTNLPSPRWGTAPANSNAAGYVGGGYFKDDFEQKLLQKEKDNE